MIFPLVAAVLIHPITGGETPPICETVLVQENPAFPHPQFSYKIRLCGDRRLPIRSITVDGAAFPEKTTTRRVITFWSNQ